MSTLTKNKKPNAFVRLTKHSEFTIGLVVIALFLLATFLTKNFFGSYNLKNLTKQGAIVGVLAVAQTFIIITSGIDISGGAIAGLGCMTMAMIMNGKGTSMLGIAILANFVVCTLCGFLNGVIIFDLKVPAMIATLGTQTIFRGILKLLCNGNSISFFEPDGATFVKLFDTIGNYDIFGVLPVLACIWIVVAVIAFLVLRYTVFGRDLFVIGSGIEVACLSGIKVRKTFYLVYPSLTLSMASLPSCLPAVSSAPCRTPATATTWTPSRRQLSAALRWPAAAARSLARLSARS